MTRQCLAGTPVAHPASSVAGRLFFRCLREIMLCSIAAVASDAEGAALRIQSKSCQRLTVPPLSVVVRVKAVSLDAARRSALVAGSRVCDSCAGIVVAVGEGTEGVHVDDEVWAFLPDGVACCELVVLPAHCVARKPCNLLFKEAAAAVVPAIEAFRCVQRLWRIKSCAAAAATSGRLRPSKFVRGAARSGAGAGAGAGAETSQQVARSRTVVLVAGSPTPCTTLLLQVIRCGRGCCFVSCCLDCPYAHVPYSDMLLHLCSFWRSICLVPVSQVPLPLLIK